VSWLGDLLGVYARVGRRGFELAIQNWWLGLVAIVYQVALLVLIQLVSPFGQLVGGFVVTLGFAALASSWFVLVRRVVREGRVALTDIPGSFGVYLGDVLTFGFMLMLLQWGVGSAIADSQYLTIVFELAIFVFFSAVPEEIYLGEVSGIAILVESYRFVAASWIEWLPATAVLWLIVFAASAVPFMPIAILTGSIALGAMFIVRGLLFLELTGSSRRAREFRRRAAS
jgi:hypothetical protein